MFRYVKKQQKYFNLETFDYTPYARELTEEEMYLVNGGRRMIGDRTNESEHVSSRPASSNESGNSSGSSSTSNSSPAPAATQPSTTSSQQNNTSAPTCTAAQMAAAQGAAMNAYFAEQDKKREENNRQNNNSGPSSSSSSSSSALSHQEQYEMAKKDYDEHYGNVASETATNNSTTYTTSDQYAMAQKDYDEHYGRSDSETTNVKQENEQIDSAKQSNKTYQIGLGVSVFLVGAVSFEIGICYSEKDGFDIYRTIGGGCGAGITGDITFSTNYSDLETESLHRSTGCTTQIGAGPSLNYDMEAGKFSGLGGIGFGGGTLWTYTRTLKGDIKDCVNYFKNK